MEVHVNVKTKKRSRRKAKPSSNPPNLSIRLNPDFDLREVVTSQTFHSNINNDESMRDNSQKTVEFDNLVKVLDPSFINNYLHKILHFLKSDVKELFFPNLTSYSESFLLKIVQEHQLLQSRSFNESSARLAEQILDLLEKNKNVFQWTHSREFSSALCKNVLVYKKLSVNESLAQDNVSKKQSTVTLASSLEDLTLTAQDRQEITPSFKTQMLNVTIKFVKDKTRQYLEYPEMPLEHAQFVYSLIFQPNHKNMNSNIGLGFKSMYTPLLEAMEKESESNDFDISFIETNNVKTSRIVFKKKPKRVNVNDSNNKTSTDLNSSNTSSTTSESSSRRRLVSRLPPAWLHAALERALQFARDPQSASLLMQNLAAEEARFMENIHVLSKEEYRDLFTPECHAMLKELVRGDADWKLTVGAKKGKKNALSTVTLQKIPFLSRRMRQTQKEAKQEVRTTERVATRKASTSKERKSLRSGINFQSAGVIEPPDSHGQFARDVTDKSDVTAECDVTEGKRLGLGGRKGKLLEAMSTPIESDKGERMMRMMGWEGGALGLRGEGLIEPIIPVLHLAPGAGLGHVKKVPPTPAEFRVGLLNRVLSLCRAEDTATAVLFQLPLSKKEGKLVTKILRALNQRMNVGLSRPEELSLVSSIEAELAEEPTLEIHALISADRKVLDLKKVTIDPNAKKNTKQKSSELQDLSLSSNGTDSISLKPKTKKAVEYRLALLNNILSFLRSSDSTTVICFYRPLSKKEGKFLTMILRLFNERKNSGLSRPEELSLAASIARELHAAPAVALHAVHGNKGIVHLHKVKRDPSPKASNKKQTDSNPPTVLPFPTTDSKEIITSNEVLILNDTYDLENSCPTEKSAKNLAYRLLFLEKIKEFLKNESSSTEVKFDIVLNTKHRNYIQGVIYEVNKRAMVKKSSELENDVYREIKKYAGDWYLSVAFSGQKFVLQKKRYQKRFVNSALGLPPPKSTDIKNTIIYKNNVPVSNGGENSDGEINIKCEYEETDSEINIKREYEETENTISENNYNEEQIEIEYVLDSELDTTKDSTVSFKSNESMLQDEIDEDSVANKEIENSFEKHLKVLQESLQEDNIVKNEVNNNNYDLIKNTEEVEYLTLCLSNDRIHKTEIENEYNSSKRSLPISNQSQNAKKYKLENVDIYVKIIPKDNKDVNIDLAKSVQQMISVKVYLNADGVLPFLKCHGIQNGALIYSCHDEKSFHWLKNLISVASNMEIIPTDFVEERTYTMKLKIGSFISLNIRDIFYVLEKYYCELDTHDWTVVDECVKENCAIFTISNMNENSYRFICKNNFTLHAGIDVVRFSVVWD